MAKKKKSDTVYVVGWKLKRPNNLPFSLQWTYEKVFEDYEYAGIYTDIEKRKYPDRIYRIEEF